MRFKLNPEWTLRIYKAALNIPFRVLDRLLKYPEPSYPQTRMLKSTYQTMLQVYRLEVSKGVFDSPDGNFERFLSVSAKLLANVAEKDRYYRKWLGLSYLLAEHEMQNLNLSPSELKAEIKRQWLDDLDFLHDLHFVKYQRDFTEIALCSNLQNLARMAPSYHSCVQQFGQNTIKQSNQVKEVNKKECLKQPILAETPAYAKTA